MAIPTNYYSDMCWTGFYGYMKSLYWLTILCILCWLPIAWVVGLGFMVYILIK